MTRYDLIQAYGSEEALDEAQKRDSEIFHSKVGVSKETLFKEREANMNTSERILQLEKELTDLRAQERAEKEEAKKQARQEREADLNKIKDLLDEFNKKYKDTICLGIKRNSDVGKDLFEALFPWL